MKELTELKFHRRVKFGSFSLTLCSALIGLIALSASAAVVQEVYSFPAVQHTPRVSLVEGSDGNFYGTTWDGGASYQSSIFKITPAGILTTLVSLNLSNGYNPSRLIQGSNGNFYGTTGGGLAGSQSSIFMMTPSGTLTTLTLFDALANGANPSALVLGTNGNFYGTTHFGTIFEATPSGTVTTLASMNQDTGYQPSALVLGNDGYFYGTTLFGGAQDNGVIFKITPSGTLTVLHSFSSEEGNLANSLVMGLDGNFYGTTSKIIFKTTPSGLLTTLFSFSGTVTHAPSNLILGSNGNFYGTTQIGGNLTLNGGLGFGTIFTVTPAGALTTLYSFSGTDGAIPNGLIQGTDGGFYGTTQSGGDNFYGTVFHMTSGGVLTTLHSFAGDMGAGPSSGLVQGSDDNLYGTTTYGGTNGDLGTIFKLTPSGKLTSLVSFNDTNGAYPTTALIQGRDGNYYGTTEAGGMGGENGTVFKMTPLGALTTLVSFNLTNGANPHAALVQGRDGNFYGTTPYGGTPLRADSSGNGTIFKMTPSGHLTTLVAFDDANGAIPRAGLIQGRDGDFYGTTDGGGPNESGTIFKMTPSGKLTVLFSFNSNNGSYPEADLLQASDGNFYGTTSAGGNFGEGFGTVFKITSSGKLTTLIVFNGTNGSSPLAALRQGADGNFYGTTSAGGANNLGTVFKMTPAGKLTTLADFNAANGDMPLATLIQARNGDLYGTTRFGDLNSGTVFKLGSLSYDALFYQTNGVTFQSSGTLNLTVDLTMSFHGTMIIGGQRYSIAGQFNSNLAATVILKRPHLPTLTVNLQLDHSLSGTISDGNWTAQLSGAPPANYSAHDPAPQTGKYSLDLVSESDGSLSPGWGSSGRVTVAPDGAISLTGVLADETMISQVGTLSASGQWPLYVPLYHGKGALLGWITFDHQPTSRFTGLVSWIKTGANGPYYPHGFTNATTAIGAIKSR